MKTLEEFMAEAEVDLRPEFEEKVRKQAQVRLNAQQFQIQQREADEKRAAKVEQEKQENFKRAPEVLRQQYGPKLAAAFDVEALYDILYLRVTGQFVVCATDTPGAASMREWARYLDPTPKETGVWAGEMAKYVPAGYLLAVDPTRAELEGIALEREKARQGDAEAKAKQEREQREAAEAERRDRQVFGVALSH